MKRILNTSKRTIFKSKCLIVFRVLCLWALLSRVSADSVVVLRKNATIQTGNAQLVLQKGTAVSVLNRGDSICVISVTLPNGAPLITQLPSSAISMPGPASNQGHATMEQLNVDAKVVSAPPKSLSPAAVEDKKTWDTDKSAADVPGYPQFKIPSNSPDSVLPGIRYTIRTGTFRLPINNSWASVVYTLPMEGDRLAESASNLIFYGPYPNEKTKLNANIVPDLVRKLGCTVFSFQFDGLGLDVSDKPYWFREAGWCDAALRARNILLKTFALEPRKLILVGYSGGGGMVMNFASAYPDQIEAVAAQAPNVIPPFPSGNKIKWLMVVNRGDSNRAIMKPFYDRLVSEKCQSLYCETTPDRNRGRYHAPSGQAFDLIYSFIAGILDQRRVADEGINDVAHLWPYASPSSPLQRYAIVKTSDLQPEDLQSGHFDFLPSLSFTMRWSQVCPPEQNIKAGNDHTRLTLNFPARSVPAGVIFYYDNPSYADIPREVEDINSLAEHGYLVVSTMTADPDEFVNAASAWVKSQDKLRGLHIHLVGNGVPGAHFISKVAARNDITFRSLSVIDFDDSWSQVDCFDEVRSAAKECGMYGFYSYSASESESYLGTWATTLVDKGAQDRGCFNVCSKPVGTVPVTESLRHTRAEDQALALIKSLIAKADAH